MGLFGWVAKGAAIGGLAGGEAERHFVSKYFTGAFQINTGTSLYGFYGERDTHGFGNDIKLVCAGSWTGLSGLLGAYLNATTGFMNLLGMTGEASICYGPRTAITYGGPKTEVLRGPQIRKICKTDLSWDQYVGASIAESLADEEPEQPVGEEVAAEDSKTLAALMTLSTLNNLVTASLELAIRFKYPEFDPKKDSDLTPKILNTVVTTISTILTGLIHGIETAGGWTQLGKTGVDDIKAKLNKIKEFAQWIASCFPTREQLLAWCKKAGQAAKNVLVFVAKAMAFLVGVGLFLGLAFVAFGGLALLKK